MITTYRLGALSLAALAVATPTAGDDHDNEPTASFTSPVNGASVAGGVEVAMTAESVTIEEAGEVHHGAGHFHVIADTGCVTPGESIIRDADHVHFGGGQTDGAIFREPGTHELCLQVGDGVHTALDITNQVTIDVGIESLEQWCAVIEEVDQLFEDTDLSDDAFAVRQVGYENIRRLVAQLDEGLDHVDPDVRDELETTLEFATDLTEAFINAEDDTDAEETVSSLFARYEQPGDLPGTEWVAEHCDTDISG
jgi:hypothetical protein